MTPIIDLENISKTEILPVCWRSTYNGKIDQLIEYEVDCRQKGIDPDPEKADELSGEKVHLRNNILENGLRYVTIHTESGEQITDDRRYVGSDEQLKGIEGPNVIPAFWHMEDQELGDGFKLKDFKTVLNTRNEATVSSLVQKEYSAEGREFMFMYSVIPPNDMWLTLKVDDMDGDDIRETQYFRFYTPRSATGEGSSSIMVAYKDAKGIESAEFRWDEYSRLEEVVGRSGDNLPAMNDPRKFEPKGTDFRYEKEEIGCFILSEAIFGKDVSGLEIDTRDTINRVIQSVMDETYFDMHEVNFK